MFGATGADFAGGLVDAGVARFGSKQWCDDFAVGVEHSGQVGVGPRTRAVGIEQPDCAGLAGRDFAVPTSKRFKHEGFGEETVAAVEVVMAAHRPCRKMKVGSVRVLAPDGAPNEAPYEPVREFGLHLARRTKY